VIERRFKRSKGNPNRANNKVELYQYINGDKVNISGHANVRETENSIRSLLGTYEEHTMTTFSQQFDITRFIDHGQTNRKDLLARFLGLNVIDDLQKSIKDETASIRTILKEYQQNDYPSILNQFEDKRKETVEKIKKLNEEKEELDKEVKKDRRRKEKLVKSLYPVVGGLRSLGVIQQDFNITSKKIEKLEEGWESNEKLKVETMSRSYWLGDQIKELNEDIPFDERKKIYYSHKKQAEGLQAEWNLRSQIAKTKEQQTQILSKHDWFETNETCQKCSFLTGAFTAKRELVEEQKWLEDAAGKMDEDNRLLTSSSFSIFLLVILKSC